MPSNTYPIIAREGWRMLAILLVIVVVVYFNFGLSSSLPFIFLLCVGLFSMRDPVRSIPSLPLALVSPAHGKIVSIKKVDDPWVPRKATRIRIRMSFLDIYSLRSPIEGKVMDQWPLRPNEEFPDRKFVFWVKTDENDDVVTVIHLNILTAVNFNFYSHSGERVGQGQRCGFLKLGGLVDVYVPENCKINIEPGQSVTSGSDVLAHLVHTEAVSSVNGSSQPTNGELAGAKH